MSENKGLVVLPLFLIISSLNFSSIDSGGNNQSGFSQSRLSGSNKNLNDGQNFDLIQADIVETPIIDKFDEIFDYSYVKFTTKSFYIADILNDNQTLDILSVKVINEPLSYNFYQLDTLSSENAVVEFLLYEGSEMSKKFYVPTNIELANIKTGANEIKAGDASYSKVITALNYETDYKSMLDINQIQNASNEIAKGDVDNAYILDYYLETKDVVGEPITLDYANPTTYSSTDDCIVNLIPKSNFMNNGTYSYGGSKWGYFVKTYSDSTKDKISNVLVYKIENIKFDQENPDCVKIYPVIAQNYRYSYYAGNVYADIPNNYCLSLPEYTSAIEYVKIPGNQKSNVYKNTWEPDYIKENDEGFCFYEVSSRQMGVLKNYHSSKNAAIDFLCSAGNLLVSCLTANTDVLLSLVIGKASDYLFEAAKNYFHFDNTEYDRKIVDGETKYKFENVVFDFNYSDFESARKGDFIKSATITDTQTDSKDGDPLLFKDNTDYIFYKSKFLGSQNGNDCTFALYHQFSANVMNDNTNIFKKNPDKVGTVTSSWSYLVGRDVNMETTNISDTTKTYYSMTGTDSSTLFIFTARETADYKLVLQDYSESTDMVVDGSTTSSGKTTKKLIDNQIIETPSKTSLCTIKHLSNGQSCIISVNRESYSTSFRLHIYKETDDLVVNPVSSTLDYYEATISSNGRDSISKFIPSKTGVHTITSGKAASDGKSIRLFDNQFNTILNSDKASSVLTAALERGKTYYIAYCSGSSSSKQEKLICLLGTYIPTNMKTTALISGLNVNEVQHFLIRPTSTKKIIFRAGFSETYTGSPKLFLGIMTPNWSLLTYEQNLVAHDVDYSLNDDSLYIISLCITSTKLTNLSVDLYVE